MRSRMIAVMLIVSVTICTAWAQDEERVLLRYQWNAGEEIVWDVVTETSGTMVMRDLTKDPVEETMLPIWSRVMMPMTLTVESVDDDGNGTVVYELGTMQMDVQAEGRQVYMEFDPATGAMTMDGQQMPVPGGMQAGMAGPYRMVISPRGEVLDIELPEGLAMMGLAGGADMTQWMKMSQQWSATFPEEPVYADYVWSTQFDAPLGTPAEEVAEGDARRPAGDGAMVYCMTGTRLVGGVDCVTLDAMGALTSRRPDTGGVFASWAERASSPPPRPDASEHDRRLRFRRGGGPDDERRCAGDRHDAAHEGDDPDSRRRAADQHGDHHARHDGGLDN